MLAAAFTACAEVCSGHHELGRLELHVQPRSTVVKIDGVTLPVPSDTLPYLYNVPQGRHSVVLRHPDREYWPVKTDIYIGPQNILHYHLSKNRMLYPSDFYVGCLGVTLGTNIGVPLLTVGGHMGGFNLELSSNLDYLSLSKVWMYGATLKAGWGVIASRTLKITPQIGWRVCSLDGWMVDLPVLATRFYIPVRRWWGVAVVPEYDFLSITCRGVLTFTF